MGAIYRKLGMGDRLRRTDLWGRVAYATLLIEYCVMDAIRRKKMALTMPSHPREPIFALTRRLQ